ncbi:MAG: tRNA guanosine(34) transglycosylase Tgt [Chitinophagaceae bacterium]|nr:MAG: tRNA guanosine(34) transglycosylase Tgt [Chitinophagaceae bacterium]
MHFQLLHKDKESKARKGLIETAHGQIQTPVFMPVGTAGTVKAVHFEELKKIIQSPVILGNTYHLYLRPGMEILQEAGGIHKFNSWDQTILTDSGGYQVYSLAEKRKITEEGVTFRSHIDGSKHFFTPENVMDIQRQIGADIIMAFDECTPYPCEKSYAKSSMEMTHRWLDRCIKQFNSKPPLYGYEQRLYPIVQGGTYDDLRRQSAEYIASRDLPGNAIGGLSVGEPAEEMYKTLEVVCPILPEDKPRYLMGVGTPQNILEAISLGIDMFDCVMPTRNGRNGMIFTEDGIINIKNKKWEKDFSPIDSGSIAPTSRIHTKAYLRHLFMSNEILGMQIASIHNLSFYLSLVREAGERIETGDFSVWKKKLSPKLSQRL